VHNMQRRTRNLGSRFKNIAMSQNVWLQTLDASGPWLRKKAGICEPEIDPGISEFDIPSIESLSWNSQKIWDIRQFPNFVPHNHIAGW
jgi:hypothetical protein